MCNCQARVLDYAGSSLRELHTLALWKDDAKVICSLYELTLDVKLEIEPGCGAKSRVCC